MMHIEVVTLFPQMVAEVGRHGVVGRAVEQGLARLDTVNPRDFADDVHRSVDDRPYGGGPGMVMKLEPLRNALRAAAARAPAGSRKVCLGPQGRRFDQACAAEIAREPGLVLLAGRYEGVDERLFATEIDEEWSIGDYVLSGGELAAMVIVDSVVRLLPGALGDPRSAAEESFADGLFDHPHYTRPEEIDGLKVPEILLGGNHEQIRRWRLQQALLRTWERRPELLQERGLNDEERALLDEALGGRRETDRNNR